jgi:hypothetical protein
MPRMGGLRVILLWLGAAVLVTALLSLPATASSAGSYTFEVEMSGDQEVPPVATAATGSGTFEFDFARNEVCYEYTASNLSSDFVDAHIHRGFVGQDGPIVVPLGPPDAPRDCVPSAGVSELDLLADYYYVNVHTQNHPGGEIRGQLTDPTIGDPSNRFTFGKARLNRKRGTARLAVRVPGPGVARLAGSKQVRPDRGRARRAGRVALRVRPRGAAKRRLAQAAKRGGTASVRIRARVTYVPEGGSPNTQVRRVRLVRRG